MMTHERATELIETVARAIWKDEGERLSPIPEHRVVNWEQQQESIWSMWADSHYRRVARVTIAIVGEACAFEAMRGVADPTGPRSAAVLDRTKTVVARIQYLTRTGPYPPAPTKGD